MNFSKQLFAYSPQSIAMTRIPMTDVLRFVAALFLPIAAPAWASEFTNSQKSELGVIIRDFLLKNPEVLRDAMVELQKREKAAQDDARKQVLSSERRSV